MQRLNYTKSPNHQITKSPNHQITKSPNHQITKSPNHQITKSPNHQITKSPNHQITKSPNHQITKSPNHQITKSPNHQITKSPNHQITKSPNHQITKSPNQQINKSPNHQINKSTNHQITKSPNQQITKSPNQQINKMPLIAPSLLSADFLQLQKDCDMLSNSEADWFHIDIMDGSFVPNISFGPMVTKFITSASKKYNDVHLMIENPDKYAEAFRDAGANNLTVHLEACPHLHRNIQQIKSLGMDAGVAINPHTPVDALKDILADIDVVCMMSVNPGFGGQAFIPHTIEKIKKLRRMIDEQALSVKIEVDGGVTLENAKSIIDAGAHVLVAGNTVFKSADPALTIASLKKIS